MSNKAQAWVWSLPNVLPSGERIPRSAKQVLGRLADYADSNWQCFPSQQLIAHELGLQVRAVRYSIQALISLGLLERVGYRYHGGESRGGRATTVYAVGPNRNELMGVDVLSSDPGNASLEEQEQLEAIFASNPKTPGQKPVDKSQQLEAKIAPKSESHSGLEAIDNTVRGNQLPALKEEPPKNLKSSSVNEVTTEPATPVRDDDDLDIRLAALDPRLSLQQLAQLMLEATGVELNPRLTDVVSAARTVLARAGGNVVDPNAYVARSLALNPGEFAIIPTAKALPAEHVHQWRDFGDGSGRLYCGSCDPAGLNPTVWEETIAAF